ncbi:MAG: hypothetical protein ABIR52_03510 [Casimicrobiaceae bacterium]
MLRADDGDGARRRVSYRRIRSKDPANDQVNIITGVSGGNFTALAYGLYGDKLFDDYETRFLNRAVPRAVARP